MIMKQLIRCIFGCLIVGVMSIAASVAQAGEDVGQGGPLTIEIRQGRVIKLPSPAAVVFVADPEIADVQTHSSTLFYLFGRRTGTTSVYAVASNDQILFRSEVRVEHATTELRRALETLSPGSAIDVASVDGAIILSGNVNSANEAGEIVEVARGYVGEEEKIINRIEVTESVQVHLRVKIAEMSRNVSRVFGFNWEAVLGFDGLSLALAIGREFQGPGNQFLRKVDPTGSVGQFGGRYVDGNDAVDGIIDALEREGLVTVLAEPSLTARSGETASFLAGGEYPIPISSDDNQISIEFKEFGVSLAFTPTVMSKERISLRVKPEVSDLSDVGAITIDGLTIPALTTRRAETTVELASGQSFAIGGLLSSSIRNSVERFPGLGNLPIIGALFRSSQFRKQETELVILVTPYLVKPVAANEASTPLDKIEVPSALETILSGKLVKTYSHKNRPSRNVTGPAGFDLGY